MRHRILSIVLALIALPALAVHHQFHAQAIAIGGDVPSAGAVALAPAGGEGNASVEHYDANGIRFDQAVSSVRGTDDGRVAVTTAAVSLRNIDILGRIHIDEINARVTGRQNRGAAEAEITIDDLRFRNVIVDGRQIIVRPDAARLNRMRTFAGFRGRDDNALALSTNVIVSGDQSLEVPGIGTLYFAEVLVKPGERSVTMLRIEFEPQQPMRHLGIGEILTNGTDILPAPQ
jgi:hypothetical protein